MDETNHHAPTRLYALSVWLFAGLFALTGVAHLVFPQPFVQIMPPYVPWHLSLVYVSGAFEIALGLLLLPSRTRRGAAWGLIALLVAVFPANVQLYLHQELLPLPAVVHLLRLPFQLVLVAWAYVYTRR